MGRAQQESSILTGVSPPPPLQVLHQKDQPTATPGCSGTLHLCHSAFMLWTWTQRFETITKYQRNWDDQWCKCFSRGVMKNIFSPKPVHVYSNVRNRKWPRDLWEEVAAKCGYIFIHVIALGCTYRLPWDWAGLLVKKLKVVSPHIEKDFQFWWRTGERVIPVLNVNLEDQFTT